MNQFDDSPEAVIAGWEGHIRNSYLSVALVFVGIALLPVLLGVGALLHFMVETNSPGLCFGAAFFPLMVAVMYGAQYGDQHNKLNQVRTLRDPTLDGKYHVIRKQWQYVRRTSVRRRTLDILRVFIPVGIGLVIWVCLIGGTIWLDTLLPDGVSKLLDRIVGLGSLFMFAYVTMLLYRDYAPNLHRRGKARGVEVIASDTRAFAPVLRHIRKRISKGPIWLVVEPPAYQLTTNYMTHQIDWEDAEHVIVMDSVDFMQSGPHLTAPEFVALIHHRDIRHIAGMDAVIAYLVDHVEVGDVVVILSIGDEVTIADMLIERLNPTPEARFW